ncbi:MAG TPA: Fe-S cluster assembly protein SufD [Pirellulales bacterium]|nr:Fe-S cluster assembly protein SufD [Pirellulales bacterium]HVA45497.1 Fe-S cluster assembly protein SufD [Pirellulales bacterium]
MTETVATSGFTRDAFDAFLSSRQEPIWLSETRTAAWEAFEKMELPSRRDEEWMRTDIRLFRLDRFGMPVDLVPGLVLPPALLTESVDLAGRTVSLNSRPVEDDVDPDLAKQGVLFGNLDEMLAEHADLLRPHLFKVVNARADKFAALHAACFSGGAVVYVPRGVRVEKPFHMFSGLASGGVDLSHALIVLEEGAEATVLAETAGDDQASLHCGSIEIVVGSGAKLRYVNLQNWGAGTWHFAHQRAVVHRDAALQWTIGALGSRLAKVNQHVVLAGEGAETQVNGAMFTEGKQHLSYHTLQHHRAAHCRSDLLYKGALQDHSHLVWRGMIKVDPGAQKTNGYQRNDNLILTETARADSIPGLEIEADDVICTHGATAGRVDDQQIFYARCRGLTRNEAVRMIVAGFFQQVFDRITIESVREALGHAIGRRIREYD